MANSNKSAPAVNGSTASDRSIPIANSDESSLPSNGRAKRKMKFSSQGKSGDTKPSALDKSVESDLDPDHNDSVSSEDSFRFNNEEAFPARDEADMLGEPPSQRPIPSDYVERLNAHREVFNREMFKTDFKEGSPEYVPKPKSKVITSDRMDEIIDVLRNRDVNPEFYLKKYGSILYDWTNTYQVDCRTIEDKETYVLLRKPYIRSFQQKSPLKRKKVEPKKPTYCKVVCRPAEIFDAIDSCHREAAHKKVSATYNLVQDYYYNITKEMVERFGKLCPVCCVKPPRTKKQVSGAVHPLHSFQYRMRFQADLIDFNNNPQVDIDGVVRRWVLVLKDHFTKYAWCRPLKRKTSRLVKHELIKLLNEVGWPLIFHTDNGSEFCAKVLTELIRDMPFICSVTGRTRVPSDQGSVERLNQEIKKLIDQIIQEQHLKGNVGFTWLDALPFVTEAINKTYGFGAGRLAPYTHVYGMDYKCPVGPPIPEDDKKAIRTVHDLAHYSEVHDMKPLLKQAGYDVDKMVQLKVGLGELQHDDDGTLNSENDSATYGNILKIDRVKEVKKKDPVPLTIVVAKNTCDVSLTKRKFDYSPVDTYITEKREAEKREAEMREAENRGTKGIVSPVGAANDVKLPTTSDVVITPTQPKETMFSSDSSDLISFPH